MKKINIRKYYPSIYNSDMLIEVPDTIIHVLKDAYRYEMAYDARVRYHKAYYSLDKNDGIESASTFFCPSAEEIVIHQVDIELLYAAILQLPEKQAHRLYAHFFLELSTNQIANREGVDRTTVSHSIRRAIENLKNFLLQDTTY
ncbi:MAG: sigma-70 family RNA polymerase sigma factor [Eubacterium sp.]